MNEKKTGSRKKLRMGLLNYLIIAVSVVILVCYVVFVDGFEALADVLLHARLRWLWAGLGLLILYWVLEAAILNIAAKKLYPKQRFLNTLKTTIIGQYFNCITPSASGGQPMQAYHMHNCGMPVGLATGALLLRFVIYQSVLTLYCAVVLLFGTQQIGDKLWLVIIGFVVNTVVVAALLGLAFVPKFIQRVGKGFIRFLSKIRIVKDVEKYNEIIDLEVVKFCTGIKQSGSDIKNVVKMCLLTVLQLTVYFLIPFFVFLALGVVLNPFLSICSSAFVLMVSSFVPLPGATGGAESSFLIFFGILLGSANAKALGPTAVLLWRIITFYFPILVGAFFTRNIARKTADAEAPEERFPSIDHVDEVVDTIVTDLDTEEIQQPPETLDNDAGEDACPQDMEKVELQEDENLSEKEE